jgi:cystathionine beta-lyase
MKFETDIVRMGRNHHEFGGAVNPPVHHVSTLLKNCSEDLYTDKSGPVYGRFGLTVQGCLQDILTELEGGFAARLFPSGLAAVTAALLAFVKAGDHALISDSVYGPTRRLAEHLLPRFGVTTTFYNPCATPADLDALVQPNTTVLFFESPGSLTFEVQDVPGLTAWAHTRGIRTVVDNTWAAGVYFKPLAHGVDLSVQAVTKYIVGHSDAIVGGVIARDADSARAIACIANDMGFTLGPDDAYLAQRGFRTMGVRLKHHEAAALKVATWLKDQPQVARVLHPAFADCPGHAIWKRDYTGSCGLFGVELTPGTTADVARCIDTMTLFGLGFSWGGFESLVINCCPQLVRTASPLPQGPLLRIHIGLEDPDDLIADLAAALTRYDARVMA